MVSRKIMLLVILYFIHTQFSLSNCLENDRIEDRMASPSNLTFWAVEESKIYEFFKHNYDQGVYDKGPAISKSVLLQYFKDFEESNGISSTTKNGNQKQFSTKANNASYNPIKVYRMLYRIPNYFILLYGIGSRTSTTRNNNWNSLIREITEIPGESDLNEAMSSIIRLHHIYDLNITEFASGKIAGIQTNTKLDAVHCYDIGLYSVFMKFYDLAVEWFELAYYKVNFESDQTLKPQTINLVLLKSILEHDNQLSAPELWLPTVYSENLWDNYQMPKIGSNHNRTRRKISFYSEWKGTRNTIFNDMNFWELCSGANFQTEKEKSQLYCWFDSGKNGMNVLNPSKMELLSSSPYVVQIYDVVGPKLAERIIKKAENSLERSKVIKSGGSKVTNTRTSANAWLYTKEDEPDLIKIEKRIESITGLKMDGDASEALQVASYVYGRHYEVHTDTLVGKRSIENSGDRTATFMIYLQEPLAGGSTAFTQAGFAAKPIQGSAVFWYNLYRNGSDQKTWHGACPVIMGHKYVANKWIRHKAQFLVAPCSLNQFDTTWSTF